MKQKVPYRLLSIILALGGVGLLIALWANGKQDYTFLAFLLVVAASLCLRRSRK